MGALEADSLGGGADAPLVLLQFALQVLPLEAGPGVPEVGEAEQGAHPAGIGAQVTLPGEVPASMTGLGEDRNPPDEVLQFPDIAGPGPGLSASRARVVRILGGASFSRASSPRK